MEFKVGDKVEVLEPQNIVGCVAKSKFVTEVIEGREKNYVYILDVDNKSLILDGRELSYLRHHKPTKNQRITVLEEKVAELEKIVEGLTQVEPAPTSVSMLDLVHEVCEKEARQNQTNNQKRAAIIEKAKKFVEKHTTPNSRSEEWRKRGAISWNGYGVIPYFTVKVDERKVTVVLKGAGVGVIKKLITVKCHEHDVFNEHIGKAIALGRALGLDVSEFEQAVQPDEVAVGMEVLFESKVDDTREIQTVVSLHENPKPETYPGIAFKTETPGWLAQSQVTITNDTNAEYPS